MDELRKSVLYVDYAATLRAASLMEARCSSTISAERRFDIVVGLKRGLDPSMVVEYMEKESIEFALQLCSPEFTLKRTALFRSAEPKAIKLLLEWPVLIPAYMYLAQCFHCEEMSCVEDFGLAAEVIADNVLHLVGQDCSISQRQALSWIDIVLCMNESDVLHHRDDRRARLARVIRCTFAKTPSVAEQGTWCQDRDGEEEHGLGNRRWLKVEYALKGRNIGPYMELAWLATVARKGTTSIVAWTPPKRQKGVERIAKGSSHKRLK